MVRRLHWQPECTTPSARSFFSTFFFRSLGMTQGGQNSDVSLPNVASIGRLFKVPKLELPDYDVLFVDESCGGVTHWFVGLWGPTLHQLRFWHDCHTGCHTIPKCLAMWGHEDWIQNGSFQQNEPVFCGPHEFSGLNWMILNERQVGPQSQTKTIIKLPFHSLNIFFPICRRYDQPWFPSLVFAGAYISIICLGLDTQAVVITLSTSLIRINQSLGSDDPFFFGRSCLKGIIFFRNYTWNMCIYIWI